jgi:hypothetical protein
MVTQAQITKLLNRKKKLEKEWIKTKSDIKREELARKIQVIEEQLKNI